MRNSSRNLPGQVEREKPREERDEIGNDLCTLRHLLMDVVLFLAVVAVLEEVDAEGGERLQRKVPPVENVKQLLQIVDAFLQIGLNVESPSS